MISGRTGALQWGARRQLQTFLRAITEGRDLGPTFRDGLRCQEVLHAATESARTRRWERVTPVPGNGP
jgi:predicted dehydrogenase